MSRITDYRQKTRKKIITPGGLELEIRKLRSIDYLKMGILPDTLQEMKYLKGDEEGDEEDISPEMMKKINKIDPEILEKINKMYLVRATIPQEDLIIVDKEIGDTKENEISYLELTEEDSTFIIQEVRLLSTDEVLLPDEDGTAPF